MSIPPDRMMGMVDSAMEAVPGMEVDISQPEDFAGGAEVIAAGGEVKVLNFEDGCSTTEIIKAIKGGRG